jgi:hypothetical protein
VIGFPLVGLGIVVAVGVIMFVIYALGLKYTYAGGRDAPGQNVQGSSSSGYQRSSSLPADFNQAHGQVGVGDVSSVRERGSDRPL